MESIDTRRILRRPTTIHTSITTRNLTYTTTTTISYPSIIRRAQPQRLVQVSICCRKYTTTPCTATIFGMNAWYTSSNRELPLLTTDYGESDFENRQREQTIRGILSWNHIRSPGNRSERRVYNTHGWPMTIAARQPTITGPP